MKKIVITHAQVPFVNGGAELQVNALKNELLKRKYNADLVTLPYKWYPDITLYNNMLMWRLLDLSESNNEKIDLVIATKFPSYGVQHDNKVAWVIHQYRQAYDLYESEHGLSKDKKGKQIREKVLNFDSLSLNECKLLFTDSNNVSNRMKYYNNIDSEPLYHPPALYGRYSCENFNDYILSVGRLDKLKRVDLLIKSIKNTNPNINFKIVGRGPELENLKKIVNSLNINGRVEFLGFVNDNELLNLYANSSAVYFAPIDEDYGYITLEAFMSKKPVITCFDSGGVLEFVKNDENGYVCEANEDSIATAVNKIFDDKERCRKFGLNGFDIVKNITWDNVIKELTKTL